MMLLLVALLGGPALAGGLHAGIPVHGVPGLGEPTFLTPASGWTAAVEGGWVRVFVGADVAEAEAWYDRTLEGIVRRAPAYRMAGADEAHGDGRTLVSFRDGNVGVLLRVERGAAALATRLLASIVEAGPGLGEVEIRRVPDCDASWSISAPGAAGIRVPSGGRSGRNEVRVREKPAELYAWDAYGRVTVVRP